MAKKSLLARIFPGLNFGSQSPSGDIDSNEPGGDTDYEVTSKNIYDSPYTAKSINLNKDMARLIEIIFKKRVTVTNQVFFELDDNFEWNMFLTQPNPSFSMADVVSITYGNIAIYTRALWIIGERNAEGVPNMIIPVDPRFFKRIIIEEEFVYRVYEKQILELNGESLIQDDGEFTDYKEDEVLYIDWDTKQGYESIGPLNLIHSTIVQDATLNVQQSKLMKKVLNSSMYINSKNKLSDDQKKKIKTWLRRSGGTVGNSVPIIEEGVITFESLSNNTTLKDNDLSPTRKEIGKIISTFFGIPLNWNGIENASGFKTAESENSFYFNRALKWFIEKIVHQFNYKLLRHSEDFIFDYDPTDLLTTDLKSVINYSKELYINGLASKNESRTKIGLDPIEDGDMFLVKSGFQIEEEVNTNEEQSET